MSGNLYHLHYRITFDMRNPALILGALEADSKDHRVNERIVPSIWKEVECSDLRDIGYIVFEAEDPFELADIERVHKFINMMDEALDVMRDAKRVAR